jgi:hypothetical protein
VKNGTQERFLPDPRNKQGLQGQQIILSIKFFGSSIFFSPGLEGK